MQNTKCKIKYVHRNTSTIGNGTNELTVALVLVIRHLLSRRLAIVGFTRLRWRSSASFSIAASSLVRIPDDFPAAKTKVFVFVFVFKGKHICTSKYDHAKADVWRFWQEPIIPHLYVCRRISSKGNNKIWISSSRLFELFSLRTHPKKWPSRRETKQCSRMDTKGYGHHNRCYDRLPVGDDYVCSCVKIFGHTF